jgi:hypothetical protein
VWRGRIARIDALLTQEPCHSVTEITKDVDARALMMA